MRLNVDVIWQGIATRTILLTLMIIALCALLGWVSSAEFQKRYWKRFRTMTMLIVVLLTTAYVDGMIFTALLALLAALAASEVWLAYRPTTIDVRSATHLCQWTFVLVVGSLPVFAQISHFFVVLIVGACGLLILPLWMSRLTQSNRRNIAVAVAIGVLCIGIPTALMVFIRKDGGFGPMVFFLAVVQLADLGAYLGGKALGKYKLIPSLSPGKTWEGLLCGVVAACFGAWIFSYTVPEWTLMALMVIAVMLTALGLLGDAFASYIKRINGLKDFGSILPGHGGVIDRFDSYFACAPLFWWLFASIPGPTSAANGYSAIDVWMLIVALACVVTIASASLYAMNRKLSQATDHP